MGGDHLPAALKVSMSEDARTRTETISLATWSTGHELVAFQVTQFVPSSTDLERHAFQLRVTDAGHENSVGLVEIHPLALPLQKRQKRPHCPEYAKNAVQLGRIPGPTKLSRPMTHLDRAVLVSALVDVLRLNPTAVSFDFTYRGPSVLPQIFIPDLFWTKPVMLPPLGKTLSEVLHGEVEAFKVFRQIGWRHSGELMSQSYNLSENERVRGMRCSHVERLMQQGGGSVQSLRVGPFVDISPYTDRRFSEGGEVYETCLSRRKHSSSTMLEAFLSLPYHAMESSGYFRLVLDFDPHPIWRVTLAGEDGIGRRVASRKPSATEEVVTIGRSEVGPLHAFVDAGIFVESAEQAEAWADRLLETYQVPRPDVVYADYVEAPFLLGLNPYLRSFEDLKSWVMAIAGTGES